MSERHPLVGAWRVAVEIPGVAATGTNLAAFAADGTVVVAFPSPTPATPGAPHRLEYWTPAFGGWEDAGDRGETMTFVALGADENGAAIGTHTVTATVAIAAGGNAWHGPFRIDVAGADGTNQHSAEGTVTATRIVAGAAPA